MFTSGIFENLSPASIITHHPVLVSMYGIMTVMVSPEDLKFGSTKQNFDPKLDLDEILIDLEVAKSSLRKEGRYMEKIVGPGGGSGLSSHRNSRQNSPRHSPRNSGMDWGPVQRRPSSVSVNSVSVELDSCSSSPGVFRFVYTVPRNLASNNFWVYFCVLKVMMKEGWVEGI